MPETVLYRDGAAELAGLAGRPTAPNGRGILLVHEIDGIGRNVRRRARMLADLGYTVLIADLYGGGRSYEGEAARAQMDALTADTGAFRRRVQAGLDRLREEPSVTAGETAAIGYCFGGLAVLELARSGADLAAAISFHGLLRTQAAARPGQVNARILACTGARDPLVPLDDVAAFQHEMDGAGVDWQLIVYGRALHSFTNPNVAGMGDPRMDYDPSADRQSWAAALLFLEEAFA